MNNIIIALLAVYWLTSTLYIYIRLPKRRGKEFRAFLFALFTSPIICPIKLIVDTIALMSDSSEVTICRHSTGDKK